MAREEHAAYAIHYEDLTREIPGLTMHQARGRAWTRLRHQFPDRYLELFAEERGGVTTDIPADIRTKSWQRATARLADVHADECREQSARLVAQGMAKPKAWSRAMAAIREADADLFVKLLTEEYQLWLEVAGRER
jgi:hypothetical protein